MAGTIRARTAAMLVVLVLGVALWPAEAMPRPRAVQDGPDLMIEAASGPIGERTMELTGENRYGPDTVALYGYLPAVVGLTAGELFTDEEHSVETARFTYAAVIAVAPPVNRADVTVTAGAGELRIYLDEGAGASWLEPSSFTDGALVATYDLDLSETLQRQAPGIGVAVGDGLMTQRLAEVFTIGDARFRFGHEGIEQRLRYVGAQMPADDADLGQRIHLTGSATVTQRESITVTLGSPSAAATPSAVADSACAPLEPWLAETGSGLAVVSLLGADIPPDADVTSLDAAALRDAAAIAAELVAAQRDLDVPDSAADAHRLAVTAMSTTARALQVLAGAVDEQDNQLWEQGRATLADSASLIERADAAVNAAAGACESGEAS